MAKYIKKKKIGNRLTRKLLLILLMVAAIFCAATWGASAKYAYASSRAGVVKAQEFYFTSDYLSPGGASYVLNPGNTSGVTFNLRNYDGKKLSELDVNYTIKVTANGVPEDKLPGYAITADKGTLTNDQEQSDAITLSDLIPGVTYTVQATGKNGYTRTLTATFVVKSDVSQIYKNTQHYKDYVIVTVWSQGAEGTATITIPAGSTPDYSDPNLLGKSAEGTIEVALGKNQSVSYRFFTSSAADVTVTVGGNTLSETDLS